MLLRGLSVFLILSLTIVGFSPENSQGQQFQPGGGKFGGGKGGPGGGKGGGMMMMDPNQLFDRVSQGKPYVLATDFRTFRDPLTQFAKDNNISDGKITRAQFAQFMDKLNKGEIKMTFGGPGGMGGPSGGPGGPGGGMGGPGGGKGGPSVTLPPGVAPTVANIDQFAEAEFKKLDQNGDGKLNADEMPRQLARQVDQYDSNKDTFIDLAEFKAYFTHLIQGNSNDPGARKGSPEMINIVANLIVEDAELDRRVTVFRAGKLPSGMPDWFAKLDTDNDGQVALFEWRKGGKALDEFTTWDLNDDGIITIEEVLRAQGRSITQLAKEASGEGAPTRPSMFANGGGGGGFGGGFGGGKGGFGGGGFGGGGFGGGKGGFGGGQGAFGGGQGGFGGGFGGGKKGKKGG